MITTTTRAPLISALLLINASTAGAVELTTLRDLHVRTNLVDNGAPAALIVQPDVGDYSDAVELLQKRVTTLAGKRLPIKTGQTVTENDFHQHIIAIGNAQDNVLVRRLLWERWVLDRWYPGDTTWAVRSVHDPYGTGKNILFVGGESPATAVRAAKGLTEKLTGGDGTATVGWVMRFETPKRGAAVDEAKIQYATKQAVEGLRFKNGRKLISAAASAGHQYYKTGQEGWAESFLIYMRHHGQLDGPGMGTHMNVYDTISVWDLIEESPAFTDEDRLFVTNRLLSIMRSKEGAHHDFFRKGTKPPTGVRHNHQTLPGLACLFGGRYFRRGYALPEADEWTAAAQALFAGQKVSHKPQCDCNCYEWGTLYQTAWWSRAGGDHAFFENGSYRMAAERALIELDNRGFSAPNGDFWSLSYFPSYVFRHAAEFYRDGRYEWALRRDPAKQRVPAEHRGVADVVRGLEPVEPLDLVGITVAPMSPHFYNARQTTMPNEPEANIPIEESFDKLAFRGGLGAKDHYLLIDGIGMGSHGHVDVNGISQFTANDRIWFTDVSYAEGPNMRDHNVLTVMQNGRTAPPPPLAKLAGTHCDGDIGFSETQLPGYSGQDWNRHIIWSKNRYFLVLDELAATQAGDYTLRCHWRSPGQGTLDGRTLTLTQQQKPGSEAVRTIRRDDADGETCVKIVGQSGTLSMNAELSKGAWTLTAIGCGHHPGDDSFFVDLDGQRAGALFLSQDKIAPSGPLSLTISASGMHTISLSLREAPGSICDKLILAGPNGQEIIVDGMDLETPAPARPVDTLTLVCVGADKLSIVRDTDNFGKWFKSYAYAEPVLNILQQSASRQMAVGSRHVFANLFFVSSDSTPIDAAIRRVADRVYLVRDGNEVVCAGIGPASFELAGIPVNVDANEFVLMPGQVALRSAIQLSWGDTTIREPDSFSGRRVLLGDASQRRNALSKAWAEAVPPTVVSTIPDGVRTSGLKAVWSQDLGVGINDAAVAASGIALACADGTVRMLTPDGEPRWMFSAKGPVNSVAISDVDADGSVEVIVGSDDRCCYMLNADGSERWHYEGAKGHDPYWARYWRGGEVEKVLAADIDGDGKQEIIFGAANMHIHACDINGKLLWRYTQYGICTSLCAADLTGDGSQEVIGGPASITCYSNCLAIDRHGKLLSKYNNDGWASALTAVCTADLDAKAPLEVICGTNMNNIYALNAAEGKLSLRWKFALGDVVTALCPARLTPEAQQSVIAGSGSEYVYALDAAGELLWTANLHAPVQHVSTRASTQSGVDEILAAADRRLHVLDATGKITSGYEAPSPIAHIAPVAGALIVVTDDGHVEKLAHRRP